MRFLCILLLLLILIDDETEGGRGGRGGRSRISSGRSRSRTRSSSGYRYSYKRRGGLSSGRFRYLFPTVGALAGIYIASRMRPHVHLHSYRDLSRYTVCQGPRIVKEADNTTRIFNYFICSDNPLDHSLVYCCQDDITQERYCCDKSSSLWSIAGTVFGIIVLVAVIAALVMWCKRRRRKQFEQEPSVIHTITPAPYMPKPSSLLSLTDEDVPSRVDQHRKSSSSSEGSKSSSSHDDKSGPVSPPYRPYPPTEPSTPQAPSWPQTPYPNPPYPMSGGGSTAPYPAPSISQPPASPQIGSGWAAGGGGGGGGPIGSKIIPESPPPPYSDIEKARIDPLAPSAPYESTPLMRGEDASK